MFLLDIYLGMEILGHPVTLMFNWGYARLFSKSDCTILRFHSSVGEFQFLHILNTGLSDLILVS